MNGFMLCRVVTAFVFLLVSQIGLANESCRIAFVSHLTATEIESTIEALAKLKIDIDTSHQGAASRQLEVSYIKKERDLIVRLRSEGSISEKEIRANIRVAVQRAQGSREVKTERRSTPEDARDRERKVIERLGTYGDKIYINRLEGGDFKVYNYNGMTGGKFVYDEKVDKPFGLASTATTEIVWRRIVEAGHKRFPETYLNGTKFLRVGSPLNKNDLRPMTGIRREEVLVWFELLNELASARDETFLSLFPDHQTGTVYRLPTEAERTLVSSRRGQVARTLPDSINELLKQAWTETNSDGLTHDVATLRPLRLDGHEFFDIYGNVYEFLSDTYRPKSEEDAGYQLVPNSGTEYVIRGGSANSAPHFVATRVTIGQFSSSPEVGFRIATDFPNAPSAPPTRKIP